MDGIKGILGSRKATMVLIAFAGLTAMLLYGRIDAQSYAMLVGGIKATWLAAHSHEESSKAKAGAVIDAAAPLAKLIDQVSSAAVELKESAKEEKEEKSEKP